MNAPRIIGDRLNVARCIRLVLVGGGIGALIMTAQMVYSGDAQASDAQASEVANGPADTGGTQAEQYDWMLGVLNENRISGRFASGATGNIGVNIAAGSENIQANQRAINAHNTVTAVQVPGPNPGNDERLGRHDTSVIGGHAFSGASGALGVNQVAGKGNQQFNTIGIGQSAVRSTGIRTLGPEELARESNTTARKDGQSGEVSSDQYRAAVKDSAFTGFGGVLQINQVSGSRNVTGNHFSISSQRP